MDEMLSFYKSELEKVKTERDELRMQINQLWEAYSLTLSAAVGGVDALELIAGEAESENYISKEAIDNVITKSDKMIDKAQAIMTQKLPQLPS